MGNRKKWLGVAGAAALASAAHGAGTIYEYNGGGTLLATTPVLSTTDKVLPLQSTTEYVDIIPETDTSALPLITLTGGPSSGRVKIYLGQNLNASAPDYVHTSNPPAKFGSYLKGLDAIKGSNTTTNLATESEFYGGVRRVARRDFFRGCHHAIAAVRRPQDRIA